MEKRNSTSIYINQPIHMLNPEFIQIEREKAKTVYDIKNIFNSLNISPINTLEQENNLNALKKLHKEIKYIQHLYSNDTSDSIRKKDKYIEQINEICKNYLNSL